MSLENEMKRCGENLSLMAGNIALESKWQEVMEKTREVRSQKLSKVKDVYELTMSIKEYDDLLMAAGMACCNKE